MKGPQTSQGAMRVTSTSAMPACRTHTCTKLAVDGENAHVRARCNVGKRVRGCSAAECSMCGRGESGAASGNHAVLRRSAPWAGKGGCGLSLLICMPVIRRYDWRPERRPARHRPRAHAVSTTRRLAPAMQAFL